MSSVMQKVLVKMVEEFSRLNDFLERYHSGAAQEHDKIAVLETEKVVLLTKNHGYFVLDQQDIIRILEQRRDEFRNDLKDTTVLGENVSKMRTRTPED